MDILRFAAWMRMRTRAGAGSCQGILRTPAPLRAALPEAVPASGDHRPCGDAPRRQVREVIADGSKFHTLTRRVTTAGTRRDALRSAMAVSLLGIGGVSLLGGAKTAAKKHKKRKRKKGNACTPNGQQCGKPGKHCKATFCLNAPFTFEANWTVTGDHDTYLFVPPENETTPTSPYIKYGCAEDVSPCEDEYPFACVSKDEFNAGSEVATIHRLLKGKYAYWIELEATTLAGDLTIVLKDSGGRIVREWDNPASPSTDQEAWHVFDINGSNGSVTAIDDLIGGTLPGAAHSPSMGVCPA